MPPLDARQAYAVPFAQGIKPEPMLRLSDWADKHRILSRKYASEPGKWRTSRTPYLREIMDCLSPTSPVQVVVFMKAAQIGGTEVGNNWLGFIIDHMPAPVMVVMPTVELAKRYSKQRLAPMISETPRLRNKVRASRARDSGNTIQTKEFEGGLLVLTGANSAVGLRSMPVRFLMEDELAAYPDDVDGEGDPDDLAIARTRTYRSRKKIYKPSTPTFTGRCKIAKAYEESDQRRYYVPCPHCNVKQTLIFDNLRWPKGEPSKVRYVCVHCGSEIEEWQKTWMLENGEWRAKFPGRHDGKVAGFHINSLYSPVGWHGWDEIAKEWEDAQGNQEKLRTFVNTVLGETWNEKGEAPDWHRIYERREQYRFNVVRAGGVVLFAGADVQKDRIEVEVVAYGPGLESWSVDYRVFPGDTACDPTTGPWKQLGAMLSEQWDHELGGKLMLRMLAVDARFNTQHVYNFVRGYPVDRVIAVMGDKDGQSSIISQPRAVDVKLEGQKTIARGIKVWFVGGSIVKSELYGWLRANRPTDEALAKGEKYPAGYCHFPEYGEEYFKQLTAEQIVVRIIKKRRRYVWEQTRERNESLDCRVYARAAAALAGIDRASAEDWEILRQQLVGVEQAPTLQEPQGGRVTTSDDPYLEG